MCKLWRAGCESVENVFELPHSPLFFENLFELVWAGVCAPWRGLAFGRCDYLDGVLKSRVRGAGGFTFGRLWSGRCGVAVSGVWVCAPWRGQRGGCGCLGGAGSSGRVRGAGLIVNDNHYQ